MSGVQVMLALGGATKADLPDPLDVEDVATTPATATASLSINSNGQYSSVGNSLAPSGVWKTGGGIGASYEVQFTTSSTTVTGAATNTWLSLGTTRTWTVANSVAGTVDSAQGTLEIRDANSGTVLATATTVSISALVTF